MKTIRKACGANGDKVCLTMFTFMSNDNYTVSMYRSDTNTTLETYWVTVPRSAGDEIRNGVEADARDVFEMACEFMGLDCSQNDEIRESVEKHEQISV